MENVITEPESLSFFTGHFLDLAQHGIGDGAKDIQAMWQKTVAVQKTPEEKLRVAKWWISDSVNRGLWKLVVTVG